MPLVTDHMAGDESAAALEILDRLAIAGGFHRRQRRHRKHITTIPILRDLCGTECVAQFVFLLFARIVARRSDHVFARDPLAIAAARKLSSVRLPQDDSASTNGNDGSADLRRGLPGHDPGRAAIPATRSHRHRAARRDRADRHRRAEPGRGVGGSARPHADSAVRIHGGFGAVAHGRLLYLGHAQDRPFAACHRRSCLLR